MARPLRIEYDGAWYHVMNRGQSRKNIFYTDHDKVFFLSLLSDIVTAFGIQIHAFSLMENHYHLLIHTPQAGLSRPMRHLNGLYTQYFNQKHAKDGSLFRGRYKAILIDTDGYLTELARYIHCNPVKAGLSKNPAAHPWTSHRHYLRPDIRFSWLSTDEILKRFGTHRQKAIKLFDRFVSTDSWEIFDEIERPKLRILGSNGFKTWVIENFVKKSHKLSPEIPKKEKHIELPVTVRQILKGLAFCYDIEIPQMRQCHAGKKNEARAVAIYLLRRQKGLSHQQIAQWLNIRNQNTLAQTLFRIKQRINTDKKFYKKIRQIEAAVLSQSQANL